MGKIKAARREVVNERGVQYRHSLPACEMLHQGALLHGAGVGGQMKRGRECCTYTLEPLLLPAFS